MYTCSLLLGLFYFLFFIFPLPKTLVWPGLPPAVACRRVSPVLYVFPKTRLTILTHYPPRAPRPARCVGDRLHGLPCRKRCPATDPGLSGDSWDEHECIKTWEDELPVFLHSTPLSSIAGWLCVLSSRYHMLPLYGTIKKRRGRCCVFAVCALLQQCPALWKCPFCAGPGAGLPCLPLPRRRPQHWLPSRLPAAAAASLKPGAGLKWRTK